MVLRWYRLNDAEIPIGVFRPRSVPILPLEAATEDIHVWPPKRRAAPWYPKMGSTAEGDDNTQALGDAEYDDLDEADDAGEAGEGDSDQDGDDSMWPVAAMSELLADAEHADEAATQGDVDGRPEAAPASASAAPKAAPAPPAVAAPSEEPHMRDGRPRAGAVVVLQTLGGSIAFYPSKNAFEAVCEQKGHGRCVLTRTQKGKRNSATGKMCGGRPVGFLAAWLAQGEHLVTKGQHWEKDKLERPLAERAALREEIAASGDAGRRLLACERPQEEGEPAEPDSLVGLLPGAR